MPKFIDFFESSMMITGITITDGGKLVLDVFLETNISISELIVSSNISPPLTFIVVLIFIIHNTSVTHFIDNVGGDCIRFE